MKRIAIVNILLKILVVILGSVIFFFPDLPQLQGRGMVARFFIFILLAFLFPFVWVVIVKKKPYPHLIDSIYTLPLIIDLGGNAAGFYKTYWQWFDKVTHFVNPLLIGIALFYVLSRSDKNKFMVWLAVMGVLSTGHVMWELFEYNAPVADKSIMGLSYLDTLSDLVMGVLAQIIVSIFIFFDPLNFYEGKKYRKKIAN